MSTLPIDTDTSSDISDDFDFACPLECPQVGDSEQPYEYESGGFHPVHLGDLYDKGRYRVVHKIGYGNTSTIWLARDSVLSAWVALKIVVAEESSDIERDIIGCQAVLSLLDDHRFITYKRYFHIDGPNGRHLCLVLPFCGPSLHSLSSNWTRMHPRWVQIYAARATALLGILHSRNICHGSIRPKNFLVQIDNLDHLDDDGIYRLLGKPLIDRVRTSNGSIPSPEVPRYIVDSIDFLSSSTNILKDGLCLIGFEETFCTSWMPAAREQPGFISLEVAMGGRPSPAGDIWALGVIILNLRAGKILFNEDGWGGPPDTINMIEKYLGSLPASWVEPLYDTTNSSPTWCKSYGTRRRESPNETRSLKQWISDIWDEPTDLNENETSPDFVPCEDNTHAQSPDWLGNNLATVVNIVKPDYNWDCSRDEVPNHLDPHKKERPYPRHYSTQFWKPSAIKINGEFYREDCEKMAALFSKISAREVDLLYDLVTQTFKYEPLGRIRVEEIISHPWFELRLS